MAAIGLLLSSLSACSSPEMRTNIALRQPAYHSSAIDFNATAQLAVDGIVETERPCWVEVCGNDGKRLDKRQHDIPLDPRRWTSVSSEGDHAELSVRTHGFREAVDSITMTLAARLPEGVRRATCKAELQVLEGKTWRSVKVYKRPCSGDRMTFSWEAPERTEAEGWRFIVAVPGARAIEWQEWRFYRDGIVLPMLTSEHFSSVWVPSTGGQEWLAVDLGKVRRFDEIRLHWLNGPAKGVLQTGTDSTDWRNLAEIGGTEATRCDTLQLHGRGRWIRVKLDGSLDGNPYILSELEVFGSSKDSGKSQPAFQAEGQQLFLHEGWQLARQAQAGDPAAWIPATVPGTVLTSYLENGYLPDPNFGDNQQYISDSYFQTAFVYRCRFTLPDNYLDRTEDEHVRLHFDGINWKADIRLNGKDVGRIEGAFTDASFDITKLLDGKNLLEVTVYPPAHPGMTKTNTLERCATNGGVLGADNPTFHASIGWDWIPTIRGRNMGIWNDVWLERLGAVRILQPMAETALPRLETMPPQVDTTRASVTLSALLCNDAPYPVETVWEGCYGEIPFRQAVSIPAGTSLPVSTRLEIEHPRLWWPNGYGKPELYTVKMRAGDSDSLSFQSGIRQLDYSTDGDNLRIWINGRRLVGRGGNWGFSESNLRYKAADYEEAMKLHRHENFNLIRNWVGMVGDEEFYEKADQYGILVWQDFWLANPADGPDPDDEAMFMQNAENLMLRIRNHPCLLLWCGRNEGFPPASLDQALEQLVHEKHPASFYISSSADGPVSGRGPYNRLPSRAYFRLSEVPWYRYESEKFHSERGMPNFPNYESLVKMMPADQAWPPSRLWGIHDFALQSAQRGSTFLAAVDSAFGPSSDARTFAARAQWINYDGYRALFESRSTHRRGLLLWMSHPAWPSMAFCTYDWFLDATASYYACRKACEPVHVQWNPHKEQVELVNYSGGERTGLRVVATVYDLHGKVFTTREALADAREDSTESLFGIDFPDCDVCYLRLQLHDGETLLSHNDYVLPQKEDNLQALNLLPKAQIRVSRQASRDGRSGSVRVANLSDTPALMLHLVARRNDGSRILPCYWSDNYIHLMPGEERTLTYEIPGGEKLRSVTVQGFSDITAL